MKPEPALERALPFDARAERSVLGAILLDNDGLSVARQTIAAGDFFLIQHRRIFERIVELAEAQQAIDLITLSECLDRHGELESAGGPAYLSQLMDGLPRATNVEHYVRIVKDKAGLRRLIHLAGEIQDRAFAGAIDAGTIDQLAGMKNGACAHWRGIFHTPEDFKSANPLRFAIKDFLQLDSATLIGGLAGHGKTFVMLAIVKALLSGEPLFGYFEVSEMAARVVYLIPESTIAPFGYRLERFGLIPYIESERLLVRTLSMGVTPHLDDPRILAAARGSDVFLDTAIRFAEGDENSASDNQRGLANDVFSLLGAGARCIVGAHHSSKNFGKETVITLENVLRGSGDVGAMVGACYGIKQIDAVQNVIHVECVKSRDFTPLDPFQLQGRPHIDQDGDFKMIKAPGDCGRLCDEQPEPNHGGGAPEAAREARSANLALLRVWLAEDPSQTSEELAKRFKVEGINVSPITVRKYKAKLRS
ncbi:MAG: DnaB-like helicase N-terminal domain-containing protein [Candidatus Acidiferrales bacterium]